MSSTKQPRWTARDGRILEAIHAYDGMLSDYQIKRLFFGVGERTHEIRLKKLMDMGLVTRPDRQHRAQLPGFTVYWLTERGARYVADLHGVTLKELGWRRPYQRWHQTIHDVEINDFRIRVHEACSAQEALTLTDWIGSREFYAHFDTVTYTIGSDTTQHTRGVRPDGYFVIVQAGYDPSRFLLEIDRATETHARIVREKLWAGYTYIRRSSEYLARFGKNAGRWLIVTQSVGESEKRMYYMRHRAASELGKAAAAFYFTTKELTQTRNILTDPIWYRGGEEAQPHCLKVISERPRKAPEMPDNA